MKEKNWRSYSYLPLHDGAGWALWSGMESAPVALSQIKSKLRSWDPKNPLLVGKPGSERFYPPVFLSETSEPAIQSFLRRHRNLLVGFMVPSLIFLGLHLIHRDQSSLQWAVVFSLFTLLFSIEYFCGKNNDRYIKEQSLFMNWLLNTRKHKAIFLAWIIFILTVGMIQVILQYFMGSMEKVFQIYGAFYGHINDGQYWRFITGAFLHYSIIHYANNLILIAMIGPVCTAIFGMRSLFVFVIGGAFGAYIQMTFGGREYDNCGGISFGIYALSGFFIANGLIDRKCLPLGLPALYIVVTLIGIISADALSENTATAGHVGGVIFGFALGCMALIKEYSRARN